MSILGVSYMHLLQVLIGSLVCLCILWLARLITLVLVLQHALLKTALEDRKMRQPYLLILGWKIQTHLYIFSLYRRYGFIVSLRTHAHLYAVWVTSVFLNATVVEVYMFYLTEKIIRNLLLLFLSIFLVIILLNTFLSSTIFNRFICGLQWGSFAALYRPHILNLCRPVISSQ